MSARRVVLSSFVLVALARATCAVADDPSSKAVLGPAEPIGELLVLKVGFDDEPTSLPPAPIPPFELSPISLPPGLLLAPADITVPDGYGMPSNGVLRATARITPSEEIAFHLSQAALRLTVAGLTEEAEHASSLLREFQAKHQPRLLLAAKQAQLNALQAEVDRLKLRVEKGITADQVQLSIKIIEVDDQVAKELFGDASKPVGGEPVNRLQSRSSFQAPKEFLRLVESKRKEGKLKVLAEPTLVTLSGRQSQFKTGGSFPIPTPQIAQAGGIEYREFGTKVLATATIKEKDLVDLVFECEVAELDQANAVVINGTSIPGITRRRITSHIELKSGQTHVVGGGVWSKDGKTLATFYSVTAEIIEPVNQLAVPLAPPTEAIESPPTLLRPVK